MFGMRDGEESIGHSNSSYCLRVACTGQGVASKPVRRQVFEALGAAPIEEVCGRDDKKRNGRDMIELHQAVGLIEGRWSQEHRIDQAEDGRVGSNAQREHQYRNRREARTPAQCSPTVPNVSAQIRHGDFPLGQVRKPYRRGSRSSSSPGRSEARPAQPDCFALETERG